MVYGQFGQPGQTEARYTEEAQLYWGGDRSRIEIFQLSKPYSSALADAANTPTTVVRPGLLVGLLTADGRAKQYDPTASDGTEVLAGVLPVELLSVDAVGQAVERVAPMVVKAPLKSNVLKILGAAFVGHAYEFDARRQLAGMSCLLDDDPHGYLAGVNRRNATKTADYTVLESDQGTLFKASGGAVTFTLPAIKLGLRFEFLAVSDNNMVIASSEADNILIGNDTASDSITFSTSGEIIGARVEVEAVMVGSTLTWLPQVKAVPFGTGSFLTQTLAT